MREAWCASRSAWAWLVALVLLAGFDWILENTSLVWRPTAFENEGSRITVGFGQSFSAVRALYAPEGDERTRIAVIGNSKMINAVHPAALEDALALEGIEDVRVQRIAVSGARAPG